MVLLFFKIPNCYFYHILPEAIVALQTTSVKIPVLDIIVVFSAEHVMKELLN